MGSGTNRIIQNSNFLHFTLKVSILPLSHDRGFFLFSRYSLLARHFIIQYNYNCSSIHTFWHGFWVRVGYTHYHLHIESQSLAKKVRVVDFFSLGMSTAGFEPWTIVVPSAHANSSTMATRLLHISSDLTSYSYTNSRRTVEDLENS